MAEQRDGVQSLPVDGPDPEMCGLQTPESIVDGSVRVRRKLPTPPITDPREVEEHVRKTIEKLRTRGLLDDIQVAPKTVIVTRLFPQ